MLEQLQIRLQNNTIGQVFIVLSSTYILVQFTLWIKLYLKRSSMIRHHGCKPPKQYPHKDIIFGFDVFLQNIKLSKTGGFLEAVRARYKRLECNTFTQLSLGRRFVQTCEPENIKAILATQFKDFDLPDTRKVAFDPIFGHGIFTTDGAEWEASRALLRPCFVRSQVGDIATFEEHVRKLLVRIPKDGSTVDLQELFFELTLDSATDFLFGSSTNVLDKSDPTSKQGEKFGEAFAYVTERAGLEARVGKIVSYFSRQKYEDNKNFVHSYVSYYVTKAVQLQKENMNREKDEKKADKSGKYVFLEHLAQQGYSERKIQDELLNILLAGRDTTAGLLSYLFYILARNPRVWKKLREEVGTLGEGIPTFEQIKSLKYMQWVLNETLRLHPIVPANGRIAVRDTTLPVGGGPDGKSPIFIKKGTVAAYQVYVMQRREDLFGENATEFIPERWETLRPGWTFVPFNGGPRICIGQQFALTEASYATVRILQTFKDIEKRDDSQLVEKLTATAMVRAGTKVGFTLA